MMFRSKNLIRCFALTIVVLISIDSWPPQTWCVRIKWPAAQVMDAIGIRQGSWVMFTPNPVINNRWVSAEKQTKDGRTINWNSPLWKLSGTWDKFVRFRHINYFNRIFLAWCQLGADDLLKYLIRSSDEPLESIQMHLNHLEIRMPEDGSLPLREETEWQLISEPWIGKRGLP